MYFILIGLKIHLKGCVHTRRDVPLQSTVHTTRPHVTANAGSERELKIFSKMKFFKQPVVALVTFSVTRYTEATRQVLQRTKVFVFFSFRLRDCQEQQSQRIILIFLWTQIILRHHQGSVLRRKGFTL